MCFSQNYVFQLALSIFNWSTPNFNCSFIMKIYSEARRIVLIDWNLMISWTIFIRLMTDLFIKNIFLHIGAIFVKVNIFEWHLISCTQGSIEKNRR